MVFATELGDGVVIGLVAVGVLAWLLWQRNWRVAGYWTAAIVFGQCLAFLIKASLQRPRPLADLYDGLSSYAFPSGHATMSTVAYGFLAVLVARQLSLPRRWRDPVALNVSTALRWLQPKPALADLPVLPQVHNGRHEALLMVGPPAQQRAEIAENQQLLLRLWNSGIVLEPGDDPLWIGNVTLQQQQQFLLLRLPVTLPQYDLPRQILMQPLDGIEQREVRRSLETMQKNRRWDGGVLLLRAR